MSDKREFLDRWEKSRKKRWGAIEPLPFKTDEEFYDSLKGVPSLLKLIKGLNND